MQFIVKRQHIGDRFYKPGETREASEADVAHLIRSGVLEPVGAKADQPLQNKAEAGAPSNKAATGRKSK